MEEIEQSYAARHNHVRKVRGKAAEYSCVDCGGPARHWSSVHDTSGLDIWNDYQPRCVRCHHIYDGVPEKQSDAMRGRKLAPETVEKLRESATGRTHSEESRALISSVKQEFWDNLSEDERASIACKITEARANETDEQRSIRRERFLQTMAAKSEEERAEKGRKRAEAWARWREQRSRQAPA